MPIKIIAIKDYFFLKNNIIQYLAENNTTNTNIQNKNKSVSMLLKCNTIVKNNDQKYDVYGRFAYDYDKEYCKRFLKNFYEYSLHFLECKKDPECSESLLSENKKDPECLESLFENKKEVSENKNEISEK